MLVSNNRQTSNHPAAKDRQGHNSNLVGALEALWRAEQKTSLYLPGHRLILEELTQAVRLFELALSRTPAIVVSVARDNLLCDDEPLGCPSGKLSAFAQLLREVDIIGIEVSRGVSVDELEQLLQLLIQARRNKMPADQLAAAVDHHAIKHVVLTPVDYRALRFTHHIDSPPENDDPHADAWLNMIKRLTDPTLNDDDDRFQEILDQIAGHLHQCEGALDALNILLNRLAAQLDNERPVHELIDALNSIDAENGPLPEETLRLLVKLVELCHQRPDMTAPIQDVLKNWGVGDDQLDPEKLDTQDVWAELLSNQSQSSFSPDAYRQQLDTHTTTQVDADKLISTRRYTDPRDSDLLRIHSAQIALQLLTEPETEQHLPNLLAHLHSATETLLERGRETLVHQTVQVAKDLCQQHNDETDLHRAAEGYLHNLKSPERVEQLLQCALLAEPPSSEILDLLATAGPYALSTTVSSRAKQGWAAIQPVFAILKSLPYETAVPVLRALLKDQKLQVRCRALSILWDLDTQPEYLKQYLQLALRDGNLQIEAAALQRLANWQTSRSLELLQAYIEGRLSDRLPSLHGCKTAVEILANRGQTGLDSLKDALDNLGKNPQKNKWARSVAQILHAQPHDVRAALTLKQHTFSPARWAYCLLAPLRQLVRRTKRD